MRPDGYERYGAESPPHVDKKRVGVAGGSVEAKVVVSALRSSCALWLPPFHAQGKAAWTHGPSPHVLRWVTSAFSSSYGLPLGRNPSPSRGPRRARMQARAPIPLPESCRTGPSRSVTARTRTSGPVTHYDRSPDAPLFSSPCRPFGHGGFPCRCRAACASRARRPAGKPTAPTQKRSSPPTLIF